VLATDDAAAMLAGAPAGTPDDHSSTGGSSDLGAIIGGCYSFLLHRWNSLT
jgi:hypothetical protein